MYLYMGCFSFFVNISSQEFMDLQDQLKHLFPDHKPQKEEHQSGINLQQEPLLCKYEKRKGKPITLIEGYLGSSSELKVLLQCLQKQLQVGGTIKKGIILLQGDYRDQIMLILKEQGFTVKRVGG